VHELSIALSIVEMVEEESARLDGCRVAAVHLRVGRLSGVVAPALLASYELACEDTLLAGSRLVIEDVPVVARCEVCDARRPVRSIQDLCCEVCGTPATDIVEGRELLVTALETEP
jgi:hydrogenase nickel incorporation protein HypA/HybF